MGFLGSIYALCDPTSRYPVYVADLKVAGCLPCCVCPGPELWPVRAGSPLPMCYPLGRVTRTTYSTIPQGE